MNFLHFYYYPIYPGRFLKGTNDKIHYVNNTFNTRICCNKIPIGTIFIVNKNKIYLFLLYDFHWIKAWELMCGFFLNWLDSLIKYWLTSLKTNLWLLFCIIFWDMQNHAKLLNIMLKSSQFFFKRQLAYYFIPTHKNIYS